MDTDLKEEEPFINNTDERSRSLFSRRNMTSESFGMQLQNCLEQITKLMKIYDPKNEFTTNAIIEYIKSFGKGDVNKNEDDLEKEQDVSLMIDFESLYSDALKTISDKDRELALSRFQCDQMAQQLDKYKQKYRHRADGTDDDSKDNVDTDVDEIVDDINNNNNHDPDLISLPNTSIDTSIQIQSDHEDEWEDGSYYSGSDYPLISDHIVFKCPNDYPPISFIKYDDNDNDNNNNNMNDDNESLDGIQTDWNSDTSDIELDEMEEREEDEDEDEFNELFQEW
eukprot:CAMPEP_0201585514 /NCGR_PEP_ID=MMETSP0190_2-20130828/122882_1 /ASSEMBLY_ACC=CAM_ASM_000263 /TAXON_ID=37353 /ORGANISM="Rosalina sp." /LENGTH=281 /DNA_ID=CAMNT_0048031611 /DNA_START=37 /DNA_END=879 /DNA_ORIENTATION=+